jgi:Zn-dependent peptidase ImmA (M78 family)
MTSMRQIFEGMQKILPSLNKKRITWRMIAIAKNKVGALLFCVPLKKDGYFVPSDASESGKPEIYINSNLSEDIQIATSVHELKHAIFDSDRSILFSNRKDWTQAARREKEEFDNFEFQACAMGALSLIPEIKLKHASRGLFDVEDEFIDDVWQIRLKLRYGYAI